MPTPGTQLTPQEELLFQVWKAQNFPQDTGEDYDLRGFYRSGGKVDPSTGHGDDKFKLPNHPTFSNLSMYSDPKNLGGQWQQDADGKWTFWAAPANLKYQSPGDLKYYFAKREKGNRVVLPNTLAQNPASQPYDVNYNLLKMLDYARQQRQMPSPLMLQY